MNKTKIAVITFLGSNCDRDAISSVEAIGAQAICIHYSETNLPDNLDGVILPGGFSFGDYVRPGCMAAHSPIMREIKSRAQSGLPVLGICNGFQLLTEAGLLPGVLLRNKGVLFVCRNVRLLLERCLRPFTHLYHNDSVLTMPIAHKYGNYYTDNKTLSRMESEGQIVMRYCDESGTITPDSNPNGSLGNIAAVCNPAGNVLGMMPHPERCADALLGNIDGEALIQGIARS